MPIIINGTLLRPREIRPGMSAANIGMSAVASAVVSDTGDDCDSCRPRMEIFLSAMGRPSMPAHSTGEVGSVSSLRPSCAMRAEFAIV